jgi:acetyl-CoA carboxylase biotin carboxylase subunit
LDTAESQALRGFGGGSVYAERLLVNPRHIEFQILSELSGQSLPLLERDCSIQRRRQKILEEAGAPNIPRADLTAMSQKAAQVLSRLGYDSLGTMETLYTPETGFSFLEVNPRLQVEHAVTEEVTGVDLVRLQILAAGGRNIASVLTNTSCPEPMGSALEARVYAEDSLRFLPSPGQLKVFRPPAQRPGIRVETGFAEGSLVTSFYDPMIAQVITHGAGRPEAICLMEQALSEFKIEGLKTNIGFLRLILRDERYLSGDLHTGLAENLIKTPEYKSGLESLS